MGKTITKKEVMHKNVSDSIANLIDIQELAHRLKLENKVIISQEADKIIRALNTLESLMPDDTCKDCGGDLDSSDKCDDPLCDLRGKSQYSS